MNVCSWVAQRVTLVDGTEVDSDSEMWRAECEARHILKKPFAPVRPTDETRRTVLEKIGQRRGPEALAAVQACMDAVEPAYVLSLPNKAQRNTYLGMVRNYVGENAADHLKNRATALHRERSASNCAAPSQ